MLLERLLEQRAAVRLIRRSLPELPARSRRRLLEEGLLPEYLNGRARVRVTSPRSMWR